MVVLVLCIRNCRRSGPPAVNPARPESVLVRDTLTFRDTTIRYVTDPKRLRELDAEVKRLTEERDFWSDFAEQLSNRYLTLASDYAELDEKHAAILRNFALFAGVRYQRGRLTVLAFDPPAGVRQARTKTWRNTWELTATPTAPKLAVRRFPLDLGVEAGLDWRTPYDSADIAGVRVLAGLTARYGVARWFVGAAVGPERRPEIVAGVRWGFEF
jgi:hypothetical protein